MNLPRFGTDDNVAYATAQLNIASANAGKRVMLTNGGLINIFHAETLETDMGLFGSAHEDVHDNPAFYTNIMSNPDLPIGYDPGNFFILHFGVFIVMKRHTGVNFCGLRRHGSTPPTAPLGVEPEPWAYRFVVVSYPPQGLTNGNCRYVLGALPGNKPFSVPPEVINVP